MVKGFGKTKPYLWHVPKFYELAKEIKWARKSSQSGDSDYTFNFNSTNLTMQILISGDWRPAHGDHELKKWGKTILSQFTLFKERAFFKSKVKFVSSFVITYAVSIFMGQFVNSKTA